MDKLLVGYDSNRIAVFDLVNKQIHPWTNKNLNRLPRNFLNRYNKFAGALQVSEQKFLLYTSYTFCVLDLAAVIPEAVEQVQNHPTRTLEGKQFNAQSWMDNLKLSQAKHLTPSQQTSGAAPEKGQKQDNLAINNRFKGVLLMDLDPATNKLQVIEHQWKAAIANFQSGAFVHKKFGH